VDRQILYSHHVCLALQVVDGLVDGLVAIKAKEEESAIYLEDKSYEIESVCFLGYLCLFVGTLQL